MIPRVTLELVVSLEWGGDGLSGSGSALESRESRGMTGELVELVGLLGLVGSGRLEG